MSTGLLANKTLLVTGSARGIGYAIVESALREGGRVIAHIGRSMPVEPKFGNHDANRDAHQLKVIAGDLSSPEELHRIWAEALAWQGRIDVLVNNAGVYVASPIEPKREWDSGWEENLATNLLAPAALCRLAITHNKETHEGIIINMVSRSSHRGDDAEHLAYGAAKGGLLALTKGIARGYGECKSIAYAVAPAWVRTEMAEAYIASVGEGAVTRELPMKEITPAADVAETVVFLASGRARHANGCTVDITGADYVR